MKLFDTHKTEIHKDLGIYTALNIQNIDQKIDHLQQLLEAWTSPTELELRLFIEQKKGRDQKPYESVLQDDALMKELVELDKRDQGEDGDSKGGEAQSRNATQNLIQTIRKAAKEDFEQTLKDTQVRFDYLFEQQRGQIEHKLSQIAANIIGEMRGSWYKMVRNDVSFLSSLILGLG
jgi:hypothetical protein